MQTIYHLDVIFDPDLDECKNGNFKTADINAKPPASVWRESNDGGNQFTTVQTDLDPFTKAKPGDKVAIAIGVQANPTTSVSISNVYVVMAQTAHEKKDLPPSPFGNNKALVQKPAEMKGYWPNENVQWWEVDLGTITPRGQGVTAEREHRFTFVAIVRINGSEYLVAHDPVMKVDDDGHN